MLAKHTWNGRHLETQILSTYEGFAGWGNIGLEMAVT